MAFVKPRLSLEVAKEYAEINAMNYQMEAEIS